MRKGLLSRRQPTKALSSLCIRTVLPGSLICRHVLETLRKLQAKKGMSVAQIGDCTCTFEEPQTRKL